MPAPISRRQMRLTMTCAKRVFCGEVMQRRESFARVCRVLHQCVNASIIGTAGHFGERPGGGHGSSGLSVTLMSDSRAFFSKNAAGTLLVLEPSPACVRTSRRANRDRVAWCCDTANRGSEHIAVRCPETHWRDLPLGRERGVVVRGDAEAGAAAFVRLPRSMINSVTIRSSGLSSRRASYRNQRNGPVVFRLALISVGILRQHILPVAHPVIGPAFSASSCRSIRVRLSGVVRREIRGPRVHPGRHPDRIERDTAQRMPHRQQTEAE